MKPPQKSTRVQPTANGGDDSSPGKRVGPRRGGRGVVRADSDSSSQASTSSKNKQGKAAKNTSAERQTEPEDDLASNSSQSIQTRRGSGVKPEIESGDRGSRRSSIQSSQDESTTSVRARRSAARDEAVDSSPVTRKSRRSVKSSAETSVKEETEAGASGGTESATSSPQANSDVNPHIKKEPQSPQPPTKVSKSRATKAASAAASHSNSQSQTSKRKCNKTDTSEPASKVSRSGRQKQLPEASEMQPDNSQGTPAPRRRTIIRVPKVMFTGVIDENRTKILKDLGGILVDSIYECTHLITDQVRRTVKFLCGLARGILVVDCAWLDRCKLANTFIDASPFVVRDVENERKFGFNLSQSLDKANDKPLLQGYKVHATKGVRPPPNDIKDIIKCAGGEFLTSMPKKTDGKVLVLSCQSDEKLCAPALKAGIPVVSAEFILTGILRQSIDIDTHALFKGGAQGSSAKRSTPASTSPERNASKRRKR